MTPTDTRPSSALAELESCRKWMIPMLMGGALRLSYHDAEDVTHDAICATLERQGILNLRAWLARTAFLGAINLLRERGLHAKHITRIARYVEQVCSDRACEAKQHETVELVQEAIAALPERLRDMVQATLDGATAEDLAELLQVSVGRVYQLLRKARQLLQDYLEPRP